MGDKGYQLQKTLMIPKKENQIRTQADRDFNKLFNRIRVLVEHAFGILKMMFPALLYGLRKRTALYSQSTIFAAVVLYNLARDFNEPEPILPPNLNLDTFDQMMQSTQVNTPCRLRNQSTFIRDQIIEKYFT